MLCKVKGELALCLHRFENFSSLPPLGKTYHNCSWKWWEEKHRASAHGYQLKSGKRLALVKSLEEPRYPLMEWHGHLLQGETFKQRVLGRKRNFRQLSKNNEQIERAKDQQHAWSKVISHLSVSTLFLALALEISSESTAVASGKTPCVNL